MLCLQTEVHCRHLSNKVAHLVRKVHKDPLVIKAQREIRVLRVIKDLLEIKDQREIKVQLDLKDHKDIWEL